MTTLLDETPVKPAVREARSGDDASAAKGWIYQFNRFQNRRLLLPLSGLAINVMLIGLCSYLLWLQPSHVCLIFGLQFLLTMSALALMGVLIVRVRRQLLNPLNLLRERRILSSNSELLHIRISSPKTNVGPEKGFPLAQSLLTRRRNSHSAPSA